MTPPEIKPRGAAPAVDSLLLTTAALQTRAGDLQLTKATGFFFERDGALYLVTSRHVVCDEPSGHFPDRLEVELHTDPANLAQAATLSLPLTGADGAALWRQGTDDAGLVDLAVLAIDRCGLPPGAVFEAFTPAHLQLPEEPVQIGSTLLVVGFPLGFKDDLHHMPVVRQATVASAFGLRFQGHGYFLTDARTHRGSSGSPVVMRAARRSRRLRGSDLPWRLLGVHSARLDVGGRDQVADEGLGLNCAWYTDMLLTLTEHAPTLSSG